MYMFEDLTMCGCEFLVSVATLVDLISKNNVWYGEVLDHHDGVSRQMGRY